MITEGQYNRRKGGRMAAHDGELRVLSRRFVLAVPVLAVCWIAVLALVLRFGGEAPAVFVPFPPADLLASLPDAAVTSVSPISLTLRSDTPDLTQRLYAAGAWLVLPAGLEGCIPGAP